MSDEQRPQDVPITEPIAPEIQQAPTIGVPVEGAGTLTPTRSNDLKAFHGEFAEFHEGYVRHYIALADTKAGFSFGIVSAILAHHLSDDKTRRLLIPPTGEVTFWISLASVLLLLVSAYFSFLVIAPRLTAPSGEGIVFFGSVATRSDASNYVGELARLSESELTSARLKHCYDISRVCASKYDRLKKAIWSGFPGLLGALFMLLAT